MVLRLRVLLSLEACDSLKQKRGALAPVLAGLRKRFNTGAAEANLQDRHDRAEIECALVGNQRRHLQSEADKLQSWLEHAWHAGQVLDVSLEWL